MTVTLSPVTYNRYVRGTTAVAPSKTSWNDPIGPWTGGDTNTLLPRGTANYRSVEDFIAGNGQSNKSFNTSTAGVVLPSWSGDSRESSKIVRGLIRRSAPDSGDAISNTRLNFMYNPESITRDYVSYLDQAALDPFNTLYQSGNLVVPPSFVNFSFDLLFDRQIETPSETPNGVLEDYNYFDMVVRNVAPSTANSQIPDNGVMMVNPKDITVIFSNELTVQGRPTNARVMFTKFTHNMVPTRMIVSLTMIITYFGPLKQSFPSDTFKRANTYQALVPYPDIPNAFTQNDIDSAVKEYNTGYDARVAESAAAPKAQLLSAKVRAGLGQVAGVAGIAGAGNGETNARIAAIAERRASTNPRPTYNQDSNLRLGPDNNPGGANTYDCSGFVYACYKEAGVNQLLGAQPGYTGSFKEQVNNPSQTGLLKVLGSGQINEASLRQNLQPGDVWLRHGGSGSNHTIIFLRWNGQTPVIAGAHNTGAGTSVKDYSMSELATATEIFRVAGSGSATAPAAAALTSDQWAALASLSSGTAVSSGAKSISSAASAAASPNASPTAVPETELQKFFRLLKEEQAKGRYWTKEDLLKVNPPSFG